MKHMCEHETFSFVAKFCSAFPRKQRSFSFGQFDIRSDSRYFCVEFFFFFSLQFFRHIADIKKLLRGDLVMGLPPSNAILRHSRSKDSDGTRILLPSAKCDVQIVYLLFITFLMIQEMSTLKFIIDFMMFIWSMHIKRHTKYIRHHVAS